MQLQIKIQLFTHIILYVYSYACTDIQNVPVTVRVLDNFEGSISPPTDWSA